MPLTKPPLDSTGVDAKLTELYALGDSDLRAEAILIRDDFRVWMDDNFDLTVTQESYLDNMDAGYLEFLADNAYIAVKNRMSIAFLPPLSPGISKRLGLVNDMDGQYNPVANTVILSGGLTITATII